MKLIKTGCTSFLDFGAVDSYIVNPELGLSSGERVAKTTIFMRFTTAERYKFSYDRQEYCQSLETKQCH